MEARSSGGENSPFEIDCDFVFELLPGPAGRIELPGHWASLMFALGDEDYVVYATFSRMPFMQRIGLFHLEQAVEKYLKCLYMTAHGSLPKQFQRGHKLEELLDACKAAASELSEPSFARFCRRLQQYADLARYPDEQRKYLAFRGFTGQIDRALTALRKLAKDSLSERSSHLLERIIERKQEWNPTTGFLYGDAELLIAESLRSALLEERLDYPPPRF